MQVINRTLVTFIAKPAFLAWINGLPGESAEVTEDNLREDCNAYLIPEVESEEELENYFKKNYKTFLEAELNDWCQEPSLWPKPLTYSLCEKFFDVDVQTVVYDLVNEDIEKEEF
jgi:hypothetical protein